MNLCIVFVLLALLVTYQAVQGSSTDLWIAVAVSVAFLAILLAYRKVVTTASPLPAERLEQGA
ncbi:hypothetical protein [Luteolibacter arcticus]|nr:hypothetical protein [Luteolibacter arcticus]